jgi:hypothetical protein
MLRPIFIGELLRIPKAIDKSLDNSSSTPKQQIQTFSITIMIRKGVT